MKLSHAGWILFFSFSVGAVSFLYFGEFDRVIWKLLGRTPRVSFQEIISIDPVDYGKKMTVNFEIANTGSADLVLDGFLTGCQCVSVLREDQSSDDLLKLAIVPARSTIRYSATYIVTGKPGQLMTHRLRSKTNDPIQPVIEITISHSVKPVVLFTPGLIDFGLCDSETVHRKSIVAEYKGTDFRLSHLTVESSRPELFRCILTKITSNETLLHLAVESKASTTSCKLDGYAYLRTPDGNLVASLPVRGTLSPDIDISPATVLLSNGTATVVISSRSGEGFRIESLDCPSTVAVQVSPETKQSERNQQILLQLQSRPEMIGARDYPVRSTLQVKTIAGKREYIHRVLVIDPGPK